MAIRLRRLKDIDGTIKMVALCAAETYPKFGDIYLDDECHYALTAKFADDFREGFAEYPDLWRLMETQKIRDAKATIEKWINRE